MLWCGNVSRCELRRKSFRRHQLRRRRVRRSQLRRGSVRKRQLRRRSVRRRHLRRRSVRRHHLRRRSVRRRQLRRRSSNGPCLLLGLTQEAMRLLKAACARSSISTEVIWVGWEKGILDTSIPGNSQP